MPYRDETADDDYFITALDLRKEAELICEQIKVWIARDDKKDYLWVYEVPADLLVFLPAYGETPQIDRIATRSRLQGFMEGLTWQMNLNDDFSHVVAHFNEFQKGLVED